MSAAYGGEGDVQDRTSQPVCRCGVPKDPENVPGLLLCPICDKPVLDLQRAEDVP